MGIVSAFANPCYPLENEKMGVDFYLGCLVLHSIVIFRGLGLVSYDINLSLELMRLNPLLQQNKK